jgi:pimeloyl-ACP methyl ester carboxylesterase
LRDGRENLFLVNAFYTNSIILKGFIDFLSESFNVIFVDLPGFALDSPPLEDVSLESFARFVRRKIDESGLDHYIIGGISFGFRVANSVRLDHKCKGIVAITPYLDAQSLQLPTLKKYAYRAVTNFFVLSGLSRRAWNTKPLRRFAHFYSHYPRERVDIILDHMDGKTFFETGKLILRSQEPCTFQDFPYVLILSKKDTTINNNYLVERFRENAKNLLILETTIDHFPRELTKEYFYERFDREDMGRWLAFINRHQRGENKASSG